MATTSFGTTATMLLNKFCSLPSEINYLQPGLPTHAVPLALYDLIKFFCQRSFVRQLAGQVATQSKENHRQSLSFYFSFSVRLVNLISNMPFSAIGILACDTLCKPTLYSHSNRLLVFQFQLHLLSEPLLRVVLQSCRKEIQGLFGYVDVNTKLKTNLSHLKVCLAHYGGEPEWVKYSESDRNNDALKLNLDRNKGLPFISNNHPTVTEWNRLYRYWKYTDWYSIISSLMLQYDNIYADISYILSKPRIYPLLNETLSKNVNPKLREKVLYGTDFYVVRNHRSEKDYWLICEQNYQKKISIK